VAAPFYNEGPTLSPEAVARLLELLVRPEAHPLYVHCLTGTHNTSLVIACLRKLQHWDPAAVRVEFARFCDEVCASSRHDLSIR
jgi:protein tyrosine/serine phosphatase